MTTTYRDWLSSRCLQFVEFSVWRRVRFAVALSTIWALAVYAFSKAGYPLNLGGGASSLTAILSMVTGLMVSFRSNSSYDRWYEGRRTWASITVSCRTTLRLLILSLPPGPPTPAAARRVAAIHELCALVCAFPISLMGHLRDRPGISSELRTILPPALLEAYASTPTSRRATPSVNGEVQHSSASETERATAALNTPVAPMATFPVALPSGAPSHVPLSLINSLHAYLNAYKAPPATSDNGTPLLDAATYSACLGTLNQFTDQLTALERIRDTPIPLVLNIHLQLLLFFYIGGVPLQLVRSMGFWCVPATSIAALIFYGVDRAGEELSEPFGEDPNDLPLGRYCRDIYVEYLDLAGVGGSSGSDFRPSAVDEK